MGKRKVVIKQSVAESIAQIAWFIESKGLVATAEKFADSVYDYFYETIADDTRTFAFCRDPSVVRWAINAFPSGRNTRWFLLKRKRRLPLSKLSSPN